MGKIYCIMGKSSSGKDTVYKKLLKNQNLKLRRIIPYTTRPIRKGEKNGEEYFFISEADVQEFQKQNKIIEMRTYHTCLGDWKYLTVKDHQMDDNNGSFLVIGTPEAYLSIRSYYGKENVIPVLIELDDGVRLQRALNREKKQNLPKYDEMCRRYLADQKDFSEEKLKECGIKKRFYNEDLEECLKQISDYILENR